MGNHKDMLKFLHFFAQHPNCKKAMFVHNATFATFPFLRNVAPCYYQCQFPGIVHLYQPAGAYGRGMHWWEEDESIVPGWGMGLGVLQKLNKQIILNI